MFVDHTGEFARLREIGNLIVNMVRAMGAGLRAVSRVPRALASGADRATDTIRAELTPVRNVIQTGLGQLAQLGQALGSLVSGTNTAVRPQTPGPGQVLNTQVPTLPGIVFLWSFVEWLVLIFQNLNIGSGGTSTQYNVWVTSLTLNVRRGPGTNYIIDTVLRQNNTVRVIGQSGDWLRLAKGGYIHSNSTTTIRPSNVPAFVPEYSGVTHRAHVTYYTRPMRIGGPLGHPMAAFGWRRGVVNNVGTRSHGGIDFYAVAGTPAFAATNGYIRYVTSNFFDGTPAIHVENDDGTWLLYGELSFAFPLSNLPIRITQGQLLGHTVDFPSWPDISPQLHLEHFRGVNPSGTRMRGTLLVNGGTGYHYVTDRPNMPFNRRRDLLDPTPIYNLPIW